MFRMYREFDNTGIMALKYKISAAISRVIVQRRGKLGRYTRARYEKPDDLAAKFRNSGADHTCLAISRSVTVSRAGGCSNIKGDAILECTGYKVRVLDVIFSMVRGSYRAMDCTYDEVVVES